MEKRNRQTTKRDESTKQHGKGSRHIFKGRRIDSNFLFTAFIVIMAAVVILNSIYVLYRIDNRPAAAVNTANPAKVLTSLQTGKNSAFTVKISDVYETDKKDPAFTLDQSETMLVLTISITNTTGEEQQLIPSNQLYVRSNEGDNVAMHASIYVTKPLAALELRPGKTATGQVSFNVPKRTAHPLLYVDLGWQGFVPIVFSVLQ